jgi:hypothetical protein
LGDLNAELGSGVLLQTMVRAIGETALHITSFTQLRENIESTLLFAQLHAALPDIQAQESSIQSFSSYMNTVGDFPADYAGAFIDENNVLHILLTNTSNQAVYQQVMDDNISANAPVFTQANFSLNELMAIQRVLSYDMIMLGVDWSEPCQRSNTVQIQLLNGYPQQQVLVHLAIHIQGFDENSVIFL